LCLTRASEPAAPKWRSVVLFGVARGVPFESRLRNQCLCKLYCSLCCHRAIEVTAAAAAAKYCTISSGLYIYTTIDGLRRAVREDLQLAVAPAHDNTTLCVRPLIYKRGSPSPSGSLLMLLMKVLITFLSPLQGNLQTSVV
jgi:hypothetical protein